MIQVRFVGYLAELAAVKTMEVEVLPGMTLLGLIEHLGRQLGTEFEAFLFDPVSQDLWPGLAVAVNGHLHNAVRSTNIALKAGDTVLFLPPASGGCVL